MSSSQSARGLQSVYGPDLQQIGGFLFSILPVVAGIEYADQGSIESYFGICPVHVAGQVAERTVVGQTIVLTCRTLIDRIAQGSMEKVSGFAVEATVTQTDGVTGLIGLNVQGATAVLLLYPGQPPVAVPEVGVLVEHAYPGLGLLPVHESVLGTDFCGASAGTLFDGSRVEAFPQGAVIAAQGLDEIGISGPFHSHIPVSYQALAHEVDFAGGGC